MISNKLLARFKVEKKEKKKKKSRGTLFANINDICEIVSLLSREFCEIPKLNG